MSITTETLFSENETANSKQITILKQNFPQCFDKKGGFLPEKMSELMQASNVDIVKESYSLNWLGKSYARLLTNLPPQGLIKSDADHNNLEKNKNSQNILIKGDNLEVLKHLTNAYRESVKMIYIDPPYNTGSDGFVYEDDFKFTSKQLVELAGIDKEEADRILEFTEKKSNSHSSWLTFMYPRLYVARDLLKDSGVIFISIDHNEQAQLKLLCDEVFGEENFIAEYIHKNNSIKNQSKLVSVSTEYLLCYAKEKEVVTRNEWRLEKKGSKDIVKLFKKLKDANLSLDIIEQEIKDMYKRPKYSHLSRWNKVDENGVFKDSDLSREGGAKDYTINNPSTGEPCVIPKRGWGKSYTELCRLQKENLIWYGDYDTAPGLKDYIGTDDLVVPDNFFYFDNSIDTRWIKDAFSALVFENPKPIEMISNLLKMVDTKNEIILDFFAGSATTAHAVIRTNAEDDGKRRFICVQLDEPTYVIDRKTDERIAKSTSKEAFNAGYESVYDITKARIEKAFNESVPKISSFKRDLGFKVFETTDDFRVKADNTLNLDNPSFFDDVQLTDEQYQSLLTTWRLYDGSELTDTVSDILLNGYTAHLCEKRLYLISPDFTVKNITALLETLDTIKDFSPNKIVIYGSNFDSANQMELNEALKSYGNKKSIDISLIVRY